MLKTKKVNKNRSKLFGVVINPKLDEGMNWGKSFKFRSWGKTERNEIFK